MRKKAKIDTSVKTNTLPSTCYSRPSKPPTREEMDQYYTMCWKAIMEKENVRRDK